MLLSMHLLTVSIGLPVTRIVVVEFPIFFSARHFRLPMYHYTQSVLKLCVVLGLGLQGLTVVHSMGLWVILEWQKQVSL